MTALTVLPSLVLGMTSFTRIIIVLSLLRQAMGTQQTPPNQVLIAIALFLTFFIMSPTLTSVYQKAGDPYLNGQIGAEAALDKATEEMKKFMVKNTRKNEQVGLEGFQTIPGKKCMPILFRGFSGTHIVWNRLSGPSHN